MSTTDFVRVAASSDLSEGDLKGIELEDGMKVCLIRADNGEVYAVEDRCSHADFPMSVGSHMGGCEVECGLHGATFDVSTGEALTPPAIEPLRRFEVKEEAGGIYVGGELK